MLKLRPHQTAGVAWLLAHHAAGSGGILADDMGLGKTVQSLAFIHELATTPHAPPALVVVPVGVLRNWEAEAARFFPDLAVTVWYGPRPDRAAIVAAWADTPPTGLVLTTYEVLLKDGHLAAPLLAPSVAIFDEGHRMKSYTSAFARDFNARFRPPGTTLPTFILSGTPIQNNLAELYTLLSIVAPHAFPLSNIPRPPPKGDAAYHSPAPLASDGAVPELVAFVAKYGDGANSDAIHALIAPFILRRVRSDVLTELPPKAEYVLTCGLSPLQRKYYRAVLTRDASALLGGTRPLSTNLVADLRKACAHPYLFEGAEPEPFVEGEHLVRASDKLALLDLLLARLHPAGHRVLLFSQSTRVLDILQDYLTLRDYSYERLDGSVRAEERFAALDAFTTPTSSTFVFLLSTRAGGVGLNLAQADTVIFFDADWNPQMDLQAIARAHRMGQTRPVRVFRLVARGTIDEVVVQRATRKLALAHAVIGVAGMDSAAVFRLATHGLSSLLDPAAPSDASTAPHSLSADTVDALLALPVGDPLPPALRDRVELVPDILGIAAPPPGSPAPPSDSLYELEGVDYSAERAALAALAAEAAPATLANLPSETDGDRAARAAKRQLAALAASDDESETESDDDDGAGGRSGAVAARRAAQQAATAAWAKAGYVSFGLAEAVVRPHVPGELVDNATDIDFVVGSVLKPAALAGRSGSACASIVTVACDDSGWWPRRGLFAALSKMTNMAELVYGAAKAAGDLALGDAVLCPLNAAAWRMAAAAAGDVYQTRGELAKPPGAKLAPSKSSSSRAPLFAALAIVLQRARTGPPSLDTPALQTSLARIAHAATELDADVHLPRLGARLPGVSWYSVERTIRKTLCRAGVPVGVYYFQRRQRLPPAPPPPPPPPSAPSPPPASLANTAVHLGFVSPQQMMAASVAIPARGGVVVAGRSGAAPSSTATHIVLTDTSTDMPAATAYAATFTPPARLLAAATLLQSPPAI